MLLVDGLAGDPQPLRDGLPRPTTRSGVVDVEHLELFDKCPQRRNRREPDLGISAVNGLRECRHLLHAVSLS